MSKKLFELTKSKLGTILVQLGFTTPFRKVIPVKKVYEDKLTFAFYHPKPLWQVHMVIVPKKKISVLGDAENSDFKIIGHLCSVAAKLIKQLHLELEGYRLITNGGKYQKIKYLHFHLVSGKQL